MEKKTIKPILLTIYMTVVCFWSIVLMMLRNVSLLTESSSDEGVPDMFQILLKLNLPQIQNAQVTGSST